MGEGLQSLAWPWLIHPGGPGCGSPEEGERMSLEDGTGVCIPDDMAMTLDCLSVRVQETVVGLSGLHCGN